MTQEILESDPNWPYSKAKTAVLSAAVAVISEGGPRAATLKNIANRASITEPAIFRHFDGVDGLFGGLFEAFEFVHTRIESAYDCEERGLGRLLAALLSISDIAAEGEDFAYILMHGEHVFRGYSDLHDKLAEMRKREWSKLMACVEDGVSRSEIRRDIDAESLAYAAQGAIHMTIRSWIESDFSFDLRAACETRVAMIERMLTAAEALRSLPKRNLSARLVAAKSAAAKPVAAKAVAAKPAVAKSTRRTATVAKPGSSKPPAAKTASAKTAAASVSAKARGSSTSNRAVEAKGGKAKPRVGAKRSAR
ncbi:MAG TPA: helix-turn-helix domain-containing protein [Rectinemataceae bacterium]|nr:helix-turn-helix domain-containing protein [Rectinemataceae bacterium]